MMKLTEKQWQELCNKTGITDETKKPDVRAVQEMATPRYDRRKKDADMKILIGYWGAIDRQWLQDYKEKQRQEKQKQKEQARQARQNQQRRPVRQQPFTLPPYKPFRFDPLPAFNAPKKLMQMGQDYIDRFYWKD